MKKFLSLVLALIMTTSLVTISAGAENFKDSSDITYAEAVEVLAAADVIDGNVDGSFYPKGGLSRGAAAKIICNLILGPTTASALKADTAPYSDVPVDHVFAGYIAYCQKEGIVSGYDDGSFKPAAPLSGYAFMKMLLGALGYDSDIEGYTGANWSVNVAKRSLNIGLDDAMLTPLRGADPVDRETACLFALNALKADMVDYDARTSVSIDGAAVVVGGSQAKPAPANKNDGNIKADGVLQFAERYFGDLILAGARDPFGRPCNVWYEKKDEIGTYPTNEDRVSSTVGTLNKAKLRGYIGEDLSDDLVNGEKTASLTIYIDGADTKDLSTDVAPVMQPAALLEKDSTLTISTRWITRSALTDIYVDNNAASGKTEVTVSIVNQHLYRATSSYSAAKGTMTATLVSANEKAPLDLPVTISLSDEDFNISGFKAEDYLLVTYSHLTNEVQSVEKARIISGTIDSYLLNTNVEIDGTTYYWHGQERVDTNGYYHASNSSLKTWQDSFTFGSTVVAVLDSRGYVIWIDALSVDDGTYANYAYIEGFATTGLLDKQAAAVAHFPDGSSEDILLKKVVGKDGNSYDGKAVLSNANCPDSCWYRYSSGDDGYTLRYVTTVSGTIDTVAKDETVVTMSVNFLPGYTAKKYKADGDTVFVFRNADDELEVITGVEKLPELSAKATVGSVSEPAVRFSLIADKDNSNYIDYAFIDYSGMGANALNIGNTSEIDNTVMILRPQTLWKFMNEDYQYTEVDALVDGSVQTIRVLREDGADESELTTGILYKNVSTTDEGYYVRGTKVGGDTLEVSGENCSNPITSGSGTLNIGGKIYVLPADVEITLVLGFDATTLKSDKSNVKYELQTGLSGKALENVMKYSKQYSYNYYGTVKEKNSTVLESLLVFVVDDVKDAANNSAYMQPSTGGIYLKSSSTASAFQTILEKENAAEYAVRVTMNAGAFSAAAKGAWEYDMKVTRNDDETVIANSTGLRPSGVSLSPDAARTLFASLLSDSFADYDSAYTTYTVEITVRYDSGSELSFKRTDVKISLAGVHHHNWDSAWSKDEDHHWHECLASECNVIQNSQKDGYGAHDFTYGDCECGQPEPPAVHTHSWASAWSKDADYHWHECEGAGTCEVTGNSEKDGYGAHAYTAGVCVCGKSEPLDPVDMSAKLTKTSVNHGFLARTASAANQFKDLISGDYTYVARIQIDSGAFTTATTSNDWSYDIKITRESDNAVIADFDGLRASNTAAVLKTGSSGSSRTLFAPIVSDADVLSTAETYIVEITVRYDASGVAPVCFYKEGVTIKGLA